MSPAVHILAVSIIFILPEVLMRMAFPWRGGMPVAVYAKTGILLAVFYLNFFLIVPRLLGRASSWWKFVTVNFVLILAVAWVMYRIDMYNWNSSGRQHKFEPDHMQMLIASASRILRDCATLALTVSLAVVIKLSDKWVELDRRQRALREAAREGELENLRTQLNPHFLFNTLNTIYSLISIDPDEAAKAVHELSGLLRYVTYENPDEVPVDREIDFVRNYVELMKLRMGSRPVTLTVDKQVSRQIAPLLFVGIVENAFKHGNTTNPADPIDIHIKVTPEATVCSTVNHVDPLAHKDSTHSGVGLPNLRRRLELLYGRRASVDMDISDGVCRVVLTIVAND